MTTLPPTPARITIYQGDARALLAGLPDASVQLVVTSPPYFGLRSYPVEPTIWDEDSPTCVHVWTDATHRHVETKPSSVSTLLGGKGDRGSGVVSSFYCTKCLTCRCAHEWGDDEPAGKPTQVNQTKWAENGAVADGQRTPRGRFCVRCSAWRGHLGNEPTLDAYIRHLTSVFTGLHRVLHPSGVLLVNLGDSYSGSGKGPTGYNGIGDQTERQGFDSATIGSRQRRTTQNRADRHRGHDPSGLPAKNLLLTPFRFAMAMQDQGWILRSVIPWIRKSGLPESVEDRPTNSNEYLFLFAQREHYFWDTTAVLRANSSPAQAAHNARYAQTYAAYDDRAAATGQPGNVNNIGIHSRGTANGRHLRTGDVFDDTLDAAIAAARADLARLEAYQRDGGLLLDADGAPLALQVNAEPLNAWRITRGYSADLAAAHYASFPRALPRTFITAATSEAGCCPACHAPYVRLVTRQMDRENRKEGDAQRRRNAQITSGGRGGVTLGLTDEIVRQTIGWRPSCACDASPPVPQTVLDLFLGSGTTAIAAQELGRHAIGFELSSEYVELAQKRIHGAAPLLTNLEIVR